MKLEIAKTNKPITPPRQMGAVSGRETNNNKKTTERMMKEQKVSEKAK